jgi:hypothetical protein
MTVNRRCALLVAFALPAGCSIQPLAALPTTPIPAPPGGPGSLRAPLVGQRWTYRQLDFFNSRLLDVVQETVVSVGPTIDVDRRADSGAALPDERHAAWGQLLRDPAWDYPMNFETPAHPLPRGWRLVSVLDSGGLRRASMGARHRQCRDFRHFASGTPDPTGSSGPYPGGDRASGHHVVVTGGRALGRTRDLRRVLPGGQQPHVELFARRPLSLGAHRLAVTRRQAPMR